MGVEVGCVFLFFLDGTGGRAGGRLVGFGEGDVVAPEFLDEVFEG